MSQKNNRYLVVARSLKMFHKIAFEQYNVDTNFPWFKIGGREFHYVYQPEAIRGFRGPAKLLYWPGWEKHKNIEEFEILVKMANY